MKKYECYICPADGGELSYESEFLKCRCCATEYLIHNEVPNFLPKASTEETFSSEAFALEWTYFSLKNYKALESRLPYDSGNREEEWGNFDLETSFIETTGLNLQDLKGKKILEVGVGSGRLLSVALKYGADCYGVDYSSSVYVAYDELRKLGFEDFESRCHVARGDLFHLPFRRDYFDIIFSIGVLHHTPDTKKAFSCLPPFLKKGGKLAIWVYAEYNRVINANVRFWRRIFRHVPPKVFFHLCKVLGSWPVVFVYRQIKILNLFMFLPCYTSVDYRDRVRTILDYYSPLHLNEHSYFEVYEWFKEISFGNIRPLKQPVSFVADKVEE